MKQTTRLTLALVLTMTAAGCADRGGGTSNLDFDAAPPATGTDASSFNGGLDAMYTGGTGGQGLPGGQPVPGGDPSPGGGGGQPPQGGDEPPPPPPPPDDAGIGGAPMMGEPGPCRDRAPDAHGACPASIYEARQDIGVGNRITVKGVVTALRLNNDGEPRNLAMQVGSAQPEYRGADFSGIWVYLGDATTTPEALAALVPGQTVELTATTNDFHGQRQLMLVEFAAAEGAAAAIVPLPVNPQEIATNGPRAAALEGALVGVDAVDVTNAEPPPGEGDRAPTNEFEVTGGLLVDDFFYRIDPLPGAGEHFRRIDGVLRWANNLSKLEPRGAADVDRPNAPPPPPPPGDMGSMPPPPPGDMGVGPPPATGPLVISELDYDQAGTDEREFVEIHNPGAEAVALAGLQLELVNGANGEVYRRFALGDIAPSLAAGGFLVVGAASVVDALPAGVPHLAFSEVPDLNDNQIQNGPDAVRLVNAAGMRLDALAYEGDVADASEGGSIDGDPSDGGERAAQRCPAGHDSNDNAADFQYLEPTPGAAPVCP